MEILPLQRALVPEVSQATPAMSLKDRFASAYLEAGADLAAIQAASNDPRTASSPEGLIALQESLQDYTKRMTVTAGLVNHAVKGAETLLKS